MYAEYRAYVLRQDFHPRYMDIDLNLMTLCINNFSNQ